METSRDAGSIPAASIPQPLDAQEVGDFPFPVAADRQRTDCPNCLSPSGSGHYLPADIRYILERWNTLQPHVREAIVTLVDATTTQVPKSPAESNGPPRWNQKVTQRPDPTWQEGERDQAATALSTLIESTLETYFALEPRSPGMSGWRNHPQQVSEELEALVRVTVQLVCNTPPGEWGGETTPRVVMEQVEAFGKRLGLCFSEKESQRIVNGYDERDSDCVGMSNEDAESKMPDIPF